MDKYLSWRIDPPSQREGILVGADITQEWLLDWWWQKYRKFNDYPVAFADFGMSSEKKEWCKEKGELIPIRIFTDFVKSESEIDPTLIQIWENSWGKRFWECRNAWFKKPFACLQSPFKKTIWFDLDCEIRGPISPLFSKLESNPIALVFDHDEKDHPVYNSGMIVFKNGEELIEKWAKMCLDQNGLFAGDQDILSYVIHLEQQRIEKIDPIYNFSRIFEEDQEAIVLHWHGDHGKVVIRNQIQFENLSKEPF